MAIHISVGTPTANSYISVAEADAYFDTVANNESWLDISLNASTGTLANTIKENLLIQATRELDTKHRYSGSKYNQGIYGASNYQNLFFPRTTDYDSNGNLYILDDVKYATAEQANWIKMRGGLRTSEVDLQRNRTLIGNHALGYIKDLITRVVRKTGSYPR